MDSRAAGCEGDGPAAIHKSVGGQPGTRFRERDGGGGRTDWGRTLG